ncbi:uncharacterized protein LOC130050711 [Ostrea edulis]|uniref:uncharacterized protein LOC130050711 n=1 Tax=Ostrea edulis TaxID=37623 RepID=UPI0024AED9EE|nr:uncharacterized protein LOC130050711 [Ostrea edulis]
MHSYHESCNCAGHNTSRRMFSQIKFTSERESGTFHNLIKKGTNVIFMDLVFSEGANTDNAEFFERQTEQRWVWIGKKYQYVLGYPEDVDVYSFGLLKAKQESLSVNISIGSFSEVCKSKFDIYLSQYLLLMIDENTTHSFKVPDGYICHSNVIADEIRDFVSDISGVQIGYDFICIADDKEEFSTVGKSYINYIVISIILLIYFFYPLIIELSFYVRDTENRFEMYYISDSPYSPVRFCRCLIFTGNNKYYAAIRIIIIITIVTSLVYLLKSHVYELCNCSLKSSNKELNFQHAENYYTTLTNSVFLVWGIFNFLLLNLASLLNSDGILDDFLIVDFTGLHNYDFILKLIPVAVFLKEQRPSDCHQKPQKPLTSLKIQKLSLILTYKFWFKVLFINTTTSSLSFPHMQFIITFPLNVILILCNTFCPLVFILYAFYVKCITLVGKCIFSKPSFRITGIIGGMFAHVGALEYIITSYIYSFNIFFYGISYIIQFFVYTVLLAVPHFSVETFIYVIFMTSFMLYICRYIYQFTKLYKNLLDEVLDLTDDKRIPIKCFEEIVDKYFPLRVEVFFLLIKIISSASFFAIIFDTMKNVGYVKIGAQPDLNTFITLLFLFGPPRFVEALVVTDFTSRVHMKHLEIKKIVKGMRDEINDNSVTTVNILSETEICQLRKGRCFDFIYRKCKTNFEYPDINYSDSSTERETCENCWRNWCLKNCCFKDCPNCCLCFNCVVRFCCTLCCGCICPVHSNKCQCCLILKVKKEKHSIDVKTDSIEDQCCCIPLLDEPENQTNPKTREDTNPKTREDTNPKTSEDTNPKTREDTNPKTSEDTNPKTREDTNPKTSEDTNPKTSEDTNPKTLKDTNPITQEDTNTKTREDTNLSTQEDINLNTREDISLDTQEDANRTSVEETKL